METNFGSLELMDILLFLYKNIQANFEDFSIDQNWINLLLLFYTRGSRFPQKFDSCWNWTFLKIF